MEFIRWEKGKSETKFVFTYSDIARIVGKKVGTVRQDKSRGKFDPEDFKSVVKYCCGRIK